MCVGIYFFPLHLFISHVLCGCAIWQVWDDQTKVKFRGRVVVPIVAVAETDESAPPAEGWFPLLDVDGNVNYGGRLYLSLRRTREPQQRLSARALESHNQTEGVGSMLPGQLHRALTARSGEESLSIFTTTWNVGNTSPPRSTELHKWIPVDQYDVYVVGVQECKYDFNRNVYKDSNTCRDDWIMGLGMHLGREYTCIKYHSLWEIRLCVFVLNKHLPRVQGVSFHKEATGIGNVLGNKGGVTVAFEIDNTSLAFVCCHLAAHQDKTTQRNKDFRQIIKETEIGRAVYTGSRTASKSNSKNGQMDLFNQFDHLFFLGDFNYRLNYAGSDKTPTPEMWSDIVSRVERRNLNALLATDQLYAEQDRGRVFQQFQEQAITFKPTFKLAKGRKLAYSVKRSPAWCDRVLWRSNPGQVDAVTGLQYGSCEEIVTSDHKPVYATFLLKTVSLKPSLLPGVGVCTMRVVGLRAYHLPSLGARENSGHAGEGKAEKEKTGLFSKVKSAVSSIKSHPFVRIGGTFMDEAHTSVAKDSTNPRWIDNELKDIPIHYTNPGRLAQCNLYVQVFLKSIKSSALLGNVAIPLSTLVPAPHTDLVALCSRAQGKSVRLEFKQALNYAGTEAGVIQGTLILDWAFWGSAHAI
jgi:hypothetical protein